MYKVKTAKKKQSYENLSKIEANFMKLYSEEEMKLLQSYETDKLELTIAESDAHIMKAKREMEENPEYRDAKEKMDHFRGAFSDTKKHALAKKNLCLLLLQKKGIVDCGETEQY